MYNAASQFETITRYADLAGTDLVATSSYSYDGIGRLTGLAHAKGANTLADYAWMFDVASRITSFTAPDGTSTYGYDATSQLTAADHDYQSDEAYEYDENGNRASTGYQTGTNNRLLSDGTYSYDYDDEGNRTKRTEIATGDYVEYKWDHRNRLVAVEFRTSAGALTKAVEFDYDAFDRLIAKRVDDTGDGTFDRAQKFVYDGLNAVLVFDDSGSLTNRMLYGPAVDQFFADEDALGEVLWGLTDNLGTVRDVAEYDAVTDETSIVNHVQYDSFGNITSESNPSASPLLKFTGRYFDEDVGLQWNWQRWYEAATALWLSQDPGGFAMGDTNLYRYVGNRPTSYIDPTGLGSEDPIEGYWGGAWNPINLFLYYPVAYGSKSIIFDNWYGNYGTALEIRAREADLEARLQARDSQRDDVLRPSLRSRNQRPVPDCYNDLIQGAETSVASMYGARPGGVTRFSSAPSVRPSSPRPGASRTTPRSRYGRNGNPDHQADVAANNGPNELQPLAVGRRVPDGVGRPGQVVTIRGRTIDPGPDGRVIVESERCRADGIPESLGREQIRDIRAAAPDDWIVATDPARPDAPPVIYPPGTQPPPRGPWPRGGAPRVPYP